MTPIIHRARWIMTEPGRFVENGFVAVKNHSISRVGRVGVSNPAAGEPGARIVDQGNGILMPALVNAHTHICLSGHARPHVHRGFIKWVERLMAERNRLAPEETEQTILAGIRALRNSGTGLVGEFGPHVPVTEAIKEKNLQAAIWLECLGNDQALPPLPEDAETIRHAWAGHAPHTTAPGLLKRVQAADGRLGRRFCLHLAESREEVRFLQTGQGAWADFMTHMGIDFSGWNCFGKRPVAMALEAGLLDRNTLAVHLLEIDAGEMEGFAQTGAHVCLCPRSNRKLHRKLPDIHGLLKAGVRPAIGTDSLASVSTLSLFDEMRFIAKNFPGLSPDAILGFGTMNGAAALGRPNLGSLRQGNQTPMIYVDLDVKNPKQAAEQLINTEKLVLRAIF